MKEVMKICASCNTRSYISLKVCTKCGSKEFEKYIAESNPGVIYNKYSQSMEIRRCPVCGGSGVITMKNGNLECSVCSH
jgi:rRNA maturation endonuclease Nob1